MGKKFNPLPHIWLVIQGCRFSVHKAFFWISDGIDMRGINVQLNHLRRPHRTFVLQMKGSLKRAMMLPKPCQPWSSDISHITASDGRILCSAIHRRPSLWMPQTCSEVACSRWKRACWWLVERWAGGCEVGGGVGGFWVGASVWNGCGVQHSVKRTGNQWEEEETGSGKVNGRSQWEKWCYGRSLQASGECVGSVAQPAEGPQRKHGDVEGWGAKWKTVTMYMMFLSVPFNCYCVFLQNVQ